MIAQAPVLTGRRVTLRPYTGGFSDGELRLLYAWARDAEVLALAGGTALELSYPRFRELFLAQLPQRNGPYEQLFALLDERARLIGRAGLFAIDARAGVAELGILIGSRESWDRRYGREAVAALAEFGFGRLGLARIGLYTFPDNLRAQRAFQACGFRRTRVLRRFSFERGVHEQVEMELTAGRFAALREGT
jgi:RimJ/RimL family protein N-acetyltransferase